LFSHPQFSQHPNRARKKKRTEKPKQKRARKENKTGPVSIIATNPLNFKTLNRSLNPYKRQRSSLSQNNKRSETLRGVWVRML